MDDIRLTRFSHGAGCGCKLSPAILDRILASNEATPDDARLLVGNSSRDDAAAVLLDDGNVLLSTTDFFMPIVDDPYEFGRIAAANAISDIYAMGGTPTVALAILGWPVDQLPPEVAQRVIDGGRSICREAGIVLAGGHSIDAPEPIFGLAVSGLVPREQLKQNDTAKPGDALFLTKGIGVGILATAQKRDLVRQEDQGVAAASMMRLNSIGAVLSKNPHVHAMTDVTGFGLLGHLGEVCAGSGAQATVQMSAVPMLTDLDYYLEKGSVPGGTGRNWESYGGRVEDLGERARAILCDPQTSGGLLVAVAPEGVDSVERALCAAGLEAFARPIGTFSEKPDHEPFIRVVG
ncbi:MAG: selenide, water dikinase SelD [Myxococcota bacterium]